MLIFDPDKRITVEEALAHQYLAALHCINKYINIFHNKN